jgi:hypothetical protein
MHLHRHSSNEVSVEAIDEPAPPSAFIALGTAQCRGMGCSAKTSIPCAYVDRRERPCPTAWCPNHRVVFEDKVYCPLHAATMRGLQCDYGDSPHPDVGNRVPALVAWVSATAEDDVVATMQSICRDRGEVLVSDPVRRVLLGHQRVRTWERAWKTCSKVGVSARVAIAVEEALPEDVLAKVNSRVVAHIRAPLDDIGTEPDVEVVEFLFRELVMPIALALDSWQQGTPVDAERPGMDRGLIGERAGHRVSAAT